MSFLYRKGLQTILLRREVREVKEKREAFRITEINVILQVYATFGGITIFSVHHIHFDRFCFEHSFATILRERERETKALLY